MIISEFGKPVTAKSLNESLAKRFGSRIKLENFTLEQLQDARNKIRTKLSQIEMSESFNTVVEGDDYQKSKLFLDVLNAEISERGDIEDDMLEAAKPDFLDMDKDQKVQGLHLMKYFLYMYEQSMQDLAYTFDILRLLLC